jgi:hypothetical protein
MSRGLRLVVAAGLCLACYGFMIGLWLEPAPGVLAGVRKWLNEPLGLGEDFGMLGVFLLLICGGYTVAAASTPVKRLLVRGVVPLVPATVLSGLTGIGSDGHLPFGLGWVVLAGALFCLLFFATKPVKVAWLVPALQLVAVAAVVLPARDVTGWPHDLGIVSSFVSLPVLGQLLWMVRSERLPAWLATPFGVGCFALLVVAQNGYRELTGWWYPLTLVYALLITLLGLSGEGRLADSAVVRWLSSRAYGLFVMLVVVGYGVLSGELVMIVPALVATGAAAELCYRVPSLVRREAVR